MDIVFLSYDEPSAETYWQVLKENIPEQNAYKESKEEHRHTMPRPL